VLAVFDPGTTAVVMVSSIDVQRAIDISHGTDPRRMGPSDRCVFLIA
jgi:hypothetical protein